MQENRFRNVPNLNGDWYRMLQAVGPAMAKAERGRGGQTCWFGAIVLAGARQMPAYTVSPSRSTEENGCIKRANISWETESEKSDRVCANATRQKPLCQLKKGTYKMVNVVDMKAATAEHSTIHGTELSDTLQWLMRHFRNVMYVVIYLVTSSQSTTHTFILSYHSTDFLSTCTMRT